LTITALTSLLDTSASMPQLRSPKTTVDLPSGGYVIIEPTEALTVIDVTRLVHPFCHC